MTARTNHASKTLTIEAPVDAVWNVATDVEQYPAWSPDIQRVEVLERDDTERARDVRFTASALGRTTQYTLRYDYTESPRVLSWKLVEGDMQRSIDGAITLGDDAAPGKTEARYDIAIELAIPLPGFVRRRAERRILTNLDGLKSRVEA